MLRLLHDVPPGCLVASWNRHDSRVLYGSQDCRATERVGVIESGSVQDHKPDSEGERERLEAAGSEVRQASSLPVRGRRPSSTLR